MRYFTFVARPKPDSAAALELGGAYVNCWMDRDNPDVSEREARADIEDSGWSIEVKEEELTTDVRLSGV